LAQFDLGLYRTLLRGHRVRPPEFGSIGTYVKLDTDGRFAGGSVIILLQPTADLACLHPDDRIISGCVAHWTLEEFHSDGAFL
jgi:hypothetical protein